MAITNGYATLPQVKLALGVKDTDDDLLIELAINAASRQIDRETGRRFWQDATVKTRLFHALSPMVCQIDDVSTTTGLIVKSDIAGTGVFDLTMTITTDFLLYPLNAALEVPVWPYDEVRVVSGLSTTGLGFATYGTRPGVSVTAKFGWPAVPDDVTQACVIQAELIYKSKDAVFGAVSLADNGRMQLRVGMHPTAVQLLEDFKKSSIG